MVAILEARRNVCHGFNGTNAHILKLPVKPTMRPCWINSTMGERYNLYENNTALSLSSLRNHFFAFKSICQLKNPKPINLDVLMTNCLVPRMTVDFEDIFQSRHIFHTINKSFLFYRIRHTIQHIGQYFKFICYRSLSKTISPLTNAENCINILQLLKNSTHV